MTAVALGHPTSGASRKLWPRVVEGPVPPHQPDLGPCLVWTGPRLPRGYGRVSLSRYRHEYAHRLAWVLTRGPIPPGLHVLHRCDNPPCVRHLFLGTQAENLADALAKGRRFTKLTTEAVADMRRRYAAGGVTQRALAAEFGVSRERVSQIVRGLGWVA